MNTRRILYTVLSALLLSHLGARTAPAADGPSLSGFVPFVGIGLTNQFETFDTDPTGAFFIADPSYAWGGSPLGPGSTAFFDVALLDTGSTAHVLTQSAAGPTGFSIQAEGFRGTNFQSVFGASGSVSLRINDPLGVYAAGLANRTAEGANLVMSTSPATKMRGQTSVSMLEGDSTWTLPNVIGLPMAAQHAIEIRNDQPQIFQLQNRTVRSPQVNLIDLGTGADQGIVRRANLRLRPSASFISGPFYLQSTEIGPGLEINFHNNPQSPTVVDSGGLYVEVDLTHHGETTSNAEFLLDTGADVTVVSSVFASSLGFDVVFDQPEFVLEVEGAGGVTGGVPGFYLDKMKIDAVGGAFVVENVPIAVIDLPNPTDPANVIDAILGTHVFNGRNIVIDAIPAALGAGAVPGLYISDPVTQTHNWAAPAASANWATPASWNASGTPDTLWVANVVNGGGIDKTAVVSANSTVFQIKVAGTPTAKMTLQINSGATLTTFGESRIDAGGRIKLAGGKLDTQIVNIYGGALSGSGQVFAGTGMISNPVRNLGGRVEPGDPVGKISIDGDYSQLDGGILAIDLGGPTAVTQYDQLAVGRFAFLDGKLEVSLVNLGGGTFSPTIGTPFTILTAAGVNGAFDQLITPVGTLFHLTYNPTSVVLTYDGLGLAGDYNHDHHVNAADYTVWRNTLGTTNPDADGNQNGTVDAGDYVVWVNNYGQSIPAAGSGELGSVPEPTSAILIFAAAIFAGCVRELRRSKGLRIQDLGYRT